MSFNKRILNKENIINNIENIMDYLGKPDAIFLTDDFSKNVYDMYKNGLSENEIIIYIINNK
jgi:hypothetical protein